MRYRIQIKVITRPSQGYMRACQYLWAAMPEPTDLDTASAIASRFVARFPGFAAEIREHKADGATVARVTS